MRKIPKFTVVIIVVLCAALLTYVGSYYGLSRSAFAEAEEQDIDYIHYFINPCPGPCCPPKHPLVSRVKFIVYYPLMWIDMRVNPKLEVRPLRW